MMGSGQIVSAIDVYDENGRQIVAEVKFLGGIQYASGINYGFGALDTPGETERATLSLGIKPKVDMKWAFETSEIYSTFSMVGAITTLDGELAGQVARSGDRAIDTDSTKLGWRNDVVDISVGGQEFTIGDGFVVGDGNFNKGAADGQYWIGAFSAWRNSAVVRLNTDPIRADVFWLRTDDDLGDARVVGVNVETTANETFGTLGLMYIEIVDDQSFDLDGMQVASIRGADVKIPGIDNLKLFGEYVIERGTSELTGRDNNANAYYIEANYQFPDIVWSPKLYYRYSHFSGNEAGSNDNEEYRGLFFTIFKRDWDTWYQGEVTGEFHLFNQNQITQMAKLKVYPRSDVSLGFWYYTHDLDTPQYFGTPVTDTDWAQEVNLAVEYYPNDRLYTYLGFAWGTPHQAAVDVFGDNDDTLVLQTFVSYTYH
ncbi:MAG: hypothetical protein ACI9BW_003228 [Gammaproteobacteria bacterium]|jgi:hypothetical protein